MKMPRVFLSITLLALAAAMAVGQQLPPGQDPKKGADKAADKGEADVVARVAKDMKNATERLEHSDPGDDTRKIQRDIVDGLDELIKQNSKSQGGGGGSKSNKKQQGASGGSGGAQSKNSDMTKGQPQDKQGDGQKGKQDDAGDQQPGKAKATGDKGPQGEPKDKGPGEGKEEDKGKGKAAGKDDKVGQTKPEENDKKDGKEGGGGPSTAKNDKGRVKTDLAADLNRNDWGHLPLTKRLEMDAYSRERFMPRFDEALQQYYRAIAEQAQRKD